MEKKQRYNQINAMMIRGINNRVFPGAVLLVAEKGSVSFFNSYGYADIFSKSKMTIDTVFDLASLTKPLATTLAIIKLVEENKITLDQKLKSILFFLKDSEKGNITIRHLLYHGSGLPAYRPYYKELIKLPSNKRRAVLSKMIVNEPLENPVGEKTLYSDIGFMILSQVIELLSDSSMNTYIYKNIYEPLNLDLFFIDVNKVPVNKKFASTEKCLWRNRALCGEVDDENAYAVGGIEGHAGLFGTAENIYELTAELMAVYNDKQTQGIFKRELLVEFFTRHPGTDRALGFDTPAYKNSSSGSYFSYNSVGHLGFSGTSFWMDLERDIIVILLTNRVHPSRHNNRIKTFRPELHDLIMHDR